MARIPNLTNLRLNFGMKLTLISYNKKTTSVLKWFFCYMHISMWFETLQIKLQNQTEGI